MSVDMTDQFIQIDIETDQWQQQVIDAFEATDEGADVSAADAKDADWSVNQANNNGYVQTSDGKNVGVDGSAFLYVNERFNVKETNKASGLSVAANIPKNVQKTIQRYNG